jgi:hypothetical protein
MIASSGDVNPQIGLAFHIPVSNTGTQLGERHQSSVVCTSVLCQRVCPVPMQAVILRNS